MATTPRQNALIERLNRLSTTQQQLAADILALRRELFALRLQDPQLMQRLAETPDLAIEEPTVSAEKWPVIADELPTLAAESPARRDDAEPSTSIVDQTPANPMLLRPEAPMHPLQAGNPVPYLPTRKTHGEWEKFVGENLLSKVGILVLIIGVGIGVKYAIDKELITPLGRILLSYTTGLLLAATAFWSFEKYQQFSAVLLSGAMTVLYFTTYFAYSFYGLLPQFLAFGLMVVFTIFTVVAALRYNRQVIAGLGMVGAYAVPFLLSDGSGRVAILYSYMALINTGLIWLAFRRQWKPLLYLAFAFTWAIFGSSILGYGKPTWVVFVFANLFFLQFYGMIVGLKQRVQEPFTTIDLLLIGSNAFLGYLFGWIGLSAQPHGDAFRGLYTCAHGALHLGLGWWALRRKLFSPALQNLLVALGLGFVAIAVPVQTSGRFITLVWAAETLALAYVARRNWAKPVLSFVAVLALLTGISYVIDVVDELDAYNFAGKLPVLNAFAAVAMVVAATYGLLLWWLGKIATAKDRYQQDLLQMLRLFAGMAAVTVFLGLGLMEIDRGFCRWQIDSRVKIRMQGGVQQYLYHPHIVRFQYAARLLYLLLFGMGAGLALKAWWRKTELAATWLVVQTSLLPTAMMAGLLICGYWREAWLQEPANATFAAGTGFLVFRYLLLALLLLGYRQLYGMYQQPYAPRWYRRQWWVLGSHLLALWWLSSELIQWIDMGGGRSEYKLGLSILWGVYALLMVGLGIGQRLRWLRIAGIALFGLTLLKLMAYDLANLSTIGKTIVFVALGLLLLIISFLYNKYRHLITDEATDDDAGPAGL